MNLIYLFNKKCYLFQHFILFFMHFYPCFLSFFIDFEIKTNLNVFENILLGKN